MGISVSHIDPSTFLSNLFDTSDTVRLRFLVRISCAMTIHGAFWLVRCFRPGVGVLREDTVNFARIFGRECGPEIVDGLLGSLVFDSPQKRRPGTLSPIVFIAGHCELIRKTRGKAIWQQRRQSQHSAQKTERFLQGYAPARRAIAGEQRVLSKISEGALERCLDGRNAMMGGYQLVEGGLRSALANIPAR